MWELEGSLAKKDNPIAFFSQKLNDAKSKYTTYKKEFYVVEQALRHWRHYLIHNEFVLYSSQEALKHINSKKKVNHKMGRVFARVYFCH